MKRPVIAILVLTTTLVLATCERSDMYNLAKYGLPPRNAIYLYQIGLSSGNAESDNDADSNCYTMGLPYHSIIGASTVKAFRSFSITEEIRLIVPARYWHYPVLGISPSLDIALISSTWAGLWDGVLDNPINTSLGLTGTNYWWSGSNADGSISVNTCGEWHDSDSASQGQAGGAGISEATATCDNTLFLLCVAY